MKTKEIYKVFAWCSDEWHECDESCAETKYFGCLEAAKKYADGDALQKAVNYANVHEYEGAESVEVEAGKVWFIDNCLNKVLIRVEIETINVII